ncbi:Dyp-type peroxidase [Rhodoferax sp.]|uniref:Dyp-type peroxidase n=1 Tax=Rhodoferax sp. TaxID=50421 RepID=UPI0026323E0B|nr:Dyp-type peroxidase [Rhodoferax sp.]MDD2925360.1 Dyp-type peroxidase [Rhodoferax sp.]
MSDCQKAVLDEVPRAGRYAFFVLVTQQVDAVRASLNRLASLVDGTQVLVGMGVELAQLLGAQVPGLRGFQALCGPGVSVPATPVALCCWLRGDDPGELWLLSRQLQQALAPGLRLVQVVDAFRYGRGPEGHGRDMTGFEDGLENPVDDAARDAALLQGAGPGLDGSSFMVVQQWLHDLDAFDAMSPQAQDHMIGRRRNDNEELDDAPASAHVKRTAQESFVPEAFALRRSMPWAAGLQAGLMFVAFGRSFDAFEAQMRRMAGLEDGVVDGLFAVSRPLTGAHFWCPPMRGGRLDLRQLGL